MKTRLWTYDQASAEMDYIESLLLYTPGKQFHYRMEILIQYLNMQHQSLWNAGYIRCAERITDKINLAQDFLDKVKERETKL